MDYLHAAILGLIQALTEFLPVSSSAHLLVLPWIFQWPSFGLFFDVALHWGTTLAVLFYFREEWAAMLLDLRQAIRSLPHIRWGWSSRLLSILILGTLPAMLLGLIAKKTIEQDLRQPWMAAFSLVLFGLLLVAADRLMPVRRRLQDIGMPDGIWIGLAQALALVPGVSRSGITLTMGRCRFMERGDAARFSFLLSTPTIFGAALLESWDFWKLPVEQHGALGPALLGMVVAAVAGFACLHYFLRFLRHAGLEVFALYRIFLAVVIWFRYHS